MYQLSHHSASCFFCCSKFPYCTVDLQSYVEPTTAFTNRSSTCLPFLSVLFRFGFEFFSISSMYVEGFAIAKASSVLSPQNVAQSSSLNADLSIYHHIAA